MELRCAKCIEEQAQYPATDELYLKVDGVVKDAEVIIKGDSLCLGHALKLFK